MTIQTNDFNNRPSLSRRVLELTGAGAVMLFFAYLMVSIGSQGGLEWPCGYEHIG